MKVRVKFEKLGAMKFIGHLDMMRYFQKAIRRAGIPIAYSEGYSPHMIMSFASPLGVGVTSSAEYFDMELVESMSSSVMTERLNEVMAEGVRVFSVRQIPGEKASKGMALVAAADYYVGFRDGLAPKSDWKQSVESFFAQETITILKRTKRSEKEVDIRPLIYTFSLGEERIFMQLASGSVDNLKPDLVMEAFYQFVGEEPQPFAVVVHRQEVYADIGTDTDRKLVTLEALGEDIE